MRRGKFRIVFRGKKGDSPTPKFILEIWGLVAVAIVFIILVYVVSQVIGIFVKDPTTELARGNFNAMTSYVDDVLNDKAPFSVLYGKPITIPDGFIIIGFDKNWGDNVLSDRCYVPYQNAPGNLVLKPTVCQNKACLVLMKDLDFEKLSRDIKGDKTKLKAYQKEIDDAVVASKVYDGVDEFSGAADGEDIYQATPGNTASFKSTQFLKNYFQSVPSSFFGQNSMFGSEYLELFGKCTNMRSGSWGVRNIKQEKIQATRSSGTAKTQGHNAKETCLTTERSLTIKAIEGFSNFRETYTSCSLAQSTQAYSSSFSYIINSPCYCSSPSISLPQNARIEIENGKATLYYTPANAPEYELASYQLAAQPLEVQNNEFSSIFSPEKINKIDIYQGDKVSLYKAGDDVSISLNEKSRMLSNACLKADQYTADDLKQRAISIFDNFVSAYNHYSPLDFSPKTPNTACVMGRFSFEKLVTDFTLPDGYTINIGKSPETNSISLYDPNGKLVKQSSIQLYNPPCYIDSSGNMQSIAYLQLSKDLDAFSLAKYAPFILDNKKLCFGLQQNPAPTTDYCDWAKPDTTEKNADSKFSSFLDCLSKLGIKQSTCDFAKAPLLPTNYRILLSNDNSGKESHAFLMKDGYVVEQQKLPGNVCIPEKYQNINSLKPICTITYLLLQPAAGFKVSRLGNSFIFDSSALAKSSP